MPSAGSAGVHGWLQNKPGPAKVPRILVTPERKRGLREPPNLRSPERNRKEKKKKTLNHSLPATCA